MTIGYRSFDRPRLSSAAKQARTQRLGIAFLASLLASQIPTAAHAWKPTTHAYLADLAVQDALSGDNMVTIPVLGSTSLSYPVDTDVLNALSQARQHYNAGVIGPDAYPDILTGQQIIHPAPFQAGVVGGADAWLTQVWNNFGATLQERAFRLGFLTHAAGDMYGHTFINQFTGAPFTIVPITNAERHIVLEGYIDKRLPTLSGGLFSASITGIEGKIYSAMIDKRTGTAINAGLYPGAASPTGFFSVPQIFSRLRETLEDQIRAYYAKKAELIRKGYPDDLFIKKVSK